VVEATTVAVTASVLSALPLPLDCAITELNGSMRTTERIDDLKLHLDPAFNTTSLNLVKSICFLELKLISEHLKSLGKNTGLRKTLRFKSAFS
jgi:hypothetical protein